MAKKGLNVLSLRSRSPHRGHVAQKVMPAVHTLSLPSTRTWFGEGKGICSGYSSLGVAYCTDTKPQLKHPAAEIPPASAQPLGAAGQTATAETKAQPLPPGTPSSATPTLK